MNKRTLTLLLAAALAATLVVAGCSKQTEPPASTPATSSAIPASPPAANVSDLDVTEHVKTALLQNESLKGFDISVVTLKGDVRLIGIVNSQAQIDEALAIARASDGAHTIHNELTLKK